MGEDAMERARKFPTKEARAKWQRNPWAPPTEPVPPAQDEDETDNPKET